MGMLGFLASGAVGGAGQGANNYFNEQQKSQNLYGNAANLAELNANLEVQKNLAIARGTQNMQLDALNDPRLQSSAQSQQTAPSAPISVPSAVSGPSQSSTDATRSNGLPSGSMTTINPNQSWDDINASYKANGGNAKAAQIALMQQEYAQEKDPQNRATLARQLKSVGGQVPGDQSGTSPAPVQQVTTQPVQSGAMWQPDNDLMKAIIRANIMDKSGASAKQILETAAPDAFGKELIKQGIYPGSQAWLDKYAAKTNKETYIAPTSIRGPGYIDPKTGEFVATPSGAVQAFSAAQEAGKNSVEPYAGLDAQGNPLPVTSKTQAASGRNPDGTPIYAAAAPGVVVGKEGLQTSLKQKWSDLNAQNQQAQTSTSYLQNIKGLAGKAAVGPASDKIDYINGLLSLVGSQKATDAVTANDLLDKYSNQIVSRLGQGGMGTDAARQILASAYPSAHMNLPAINEAVDNIVGANDMVKSKAALLAPHAANLDPIAYQQKELAFDQNADPRIWQFKNIQDPATKKAFAQSVLKQDPNFIQKLHVLDDLGVK